MKVRLRKTFFWNSRRYRPNTDGVEVPDDAKLPSDAEIWNGEKWVPAYAPGESPRDRAASIREDRANRTRAMADAMAGAAMAMPLEDQAVLDERAPLNPEAHVKQPDEPTRSRSEGEAKAKAQAEAKAKAEEQARATAKR